jgi:hypothetical protein
MEIFGCDCTHVLPHVGGIWLFQKRTETLAFVQDWLRFSEDLELITDAPSIPRTTPTSPGEPPRPEHLLPPPHKHGLELILEDRISPRENAPIIHAARKE